MIDIEKIEKRDNNKLDEDKITQGDTDYFSHPIYGNDEKLVRKFLESYPKNNDKNIVVQKIRLIDLLNSTQLGNHRYKATDKGFLEEVLADAITKKRDLDSLIENGEAEAVDYITYAAVKYNFPRLPSFASKYCCYHQMYAFESSEKNYPIYDSVLCKTLPQYVKGVSAYYLENIFRNSSEEDKPYKEYRDIINKVFDTYGMSRNDPKFEGKAYSMLDHYLWFNYKITEKKGKKNAAV